jgi:hypothetical protein
MTTQEFINTLEQNSNQNKELLFEFSKNQIADTNYHLTEVKNVTFETVDCGGNSNNWKETHLQLWESPAEKGKTGYITVDKALSIINRVHSIKPLLYNAELKVEFGNENFHTSVLNVDSFEIKENQIITKLFVEKTRCKAPDVCGTDEVKEEASCCSDTGCC